jgi:glycosyltransferase involved in cell wall biosynthesis
VVAGAGTERPWRTLARELGIESRVDFRAFVEDISPLLASADLLLCPTRYEPYGLAIQEGIMAGVPPLVSNGVAGIVDRLPDALEELLIDDFENHVEWARRIRSCLRQLESLRARTASAAALFAQRSWDDFADEFIETVEDRLGLASRQHREGLRGAGE